MQCNIYNMYLTSSLMGRPIWMKSCTKIVTHEVIVNMYKLYKRFVINPCWFWYSATPLWMQFCLCHFKCTLFVLNLTITESTTGLIYRSWIWTEGRRLYIFHFVQLNLLYFILILYFPLIFAKIIYINQLGKY